MVTRAHIFRHIAELLRPPQQSAHRQCVFFSLISFDVGAFLTLPGAKPDDTAVERRSTLASRNALTINVILKAATASPSQIARTSRTFIFGQVDPLCIRRTLGRFGRRFGQPSALSECGKINSRWGIPPTRAIAGAKLQSDLLVAIGNPQRRTRNRIWLRGSQWSGSSGSFASPRSLCRSRRLRRN